MKNFCIILSIVLLLSCNSNEQKKESSTAQTNSTDAGLINNSNHIDSLKNPSTIQSDVNIQLNNKIQIAFAADSNSITVKGYLDSIGSSVSCEIPVTTGKKIIAKIEPIKIPANIRFNQIIFPDASSDGPFGKELTYDLSQQGIYTIIIGSNLMAENAYTGDFLLHLMIK